MESHVRLAQGSHQLIVEHSPREVLMAPQGQRADKIQALKVMVLCLLSFRLLVNQFLFHERFSLRVAGDAITLEDIVSQTRWNERLEAAAAASLSGGFTAPGPSSIV